MIDEENNYYNNNDIAEAEEALDALVGYVGEYIEPNGGIRMLNPFRVDNVRLCASVLRKYVKGDNLKIEWEIHKPVECSAYISIEGKNISMEDTRWIARVGSLANNMEIYPLLDGGVRMTFTFYGITKEIG